MRDDRNPEPLTSRPERLRDEPSAIDRELADALAVEPSPDFVARVRMRVENEPAPRRAWVGWTTWMPVTAGVLVAATVVMMVVAPHPKVAPAPGSDRVLPAAARTSAPTSAPATGSAVAPAAVPSAVASSTPDRTHPSTALGAANATAKTATWGAHAEPEVLVAQDEAAALRRLFARASQGHLLGASFASEPPEAAGDVMSLEIEIAIAPIKIDPLMPVNGEEGVRQ